MLDIIYTNQTTTYFSKSDFEYLNKLRESFETGDKTKVKALLAEFEKIGKNGIVLDLEYDVLNFFELKNDERYYYRIKEKFRSLNTNEIKELILKRFDSIKGEKFDLPETVYTMEIVSINYEGNLIPVKTLLIKNWDFILYETTRTPKRHYVEIEYGSHALYTLTKLISEQDSELISTEGFEIINQLIDKYR